MAKVKTVDIYWLNYTEMMQDDLTGTSVKTTDEIGEEIEGMINARSYVDHLGMELDEFYDPERRFYCGMTTIWSFSVDVPIRSIHPLLREIAGIDEYLHLFVKAKDEWGDERCYEIQSGEVASHK